VQTARNYLLQGPSYTVLKSLLANAKFCNFWLVAMATGGDEGKFK